MRYHSSAPVGFAILLMASAAFAGEGQKVLFDFSEPSAFEGWRVEDDGVMGGVSRGNFTRDTEGHAVFSGNVSMENNGGFSSVQKSFESIDVSAFRKAVIRLRGDGKDYRFIVESENNARHYYVAEFSTDGGWQEVEIPLADLSPARRGDRLNLPNFPGQTMAQVRFMIANGRAEDFRLEIAEVRLE
jgi:NADH dehydrogenase [ubiquinone] 1 alpha subcomplex assembly factor 1